MLHRNKILCVQNMTLKQNLFLWSVVVVVLKVM